MRRAITIANRALGPGHPCWIIAEAGVNHNGDLVMAKRLVDAAQEAGADVVKFQTFCAQRLASPSAPTAAYQRQGSRQEESQRELLARLELSRAAHQELAAHCRQRGIIFLSSPFEEESADFLAQLGVPAFKIPSGELTNLPLLVHVARYQRPMLVSTGMATLSEVEHAVRAIRGAGNEEVVLLHCVSSYPADPADANLRAMQTLAATFEVPVGYSDHTPGLAVAWAAVALGACLIEKHFTLDHALPGPDHRASLEPDELAALVRGIRNVELALGHGRKEPAASERETAAVARKSLVAARDLASGSRLAEADIAIQRPGTGLAPSLRARLVGRILTRDVPAGTVLTWDVLK